MKTSVLVAALLAMGCSKDSATPAAAPAKAGPGEACARTPDCAQALRCRGGACVSADAIPEPGAVDDASPSPDPSAGGGDDPVAGDDTNGDDPPDGADDPDPPDPPDPQPEGWVDDGWRPTFEGVGGCPGAHHRDAASDECVADHPARMDAEASCWSGGQVAPDGVGRPCHPTDRPCDGLQASCCLVDAKLYGAQCVKPCSQQSECGGGQWCHTGKGVCMRASCEQLIVDWYDDHRFSASQGFSCAADAGISAAVNATGVGAACEGGGRGCAPPPEASDDARGAWRATECLGTVTDLLPRSKPSFCTFTCAADADCGSGASCIRSNGPPFFCAPTAACAGYFPGKIFRRHPNTIEEPCWPHPGRAPR